MNMMRIRCPHCGMEGQIPTPPNDQVMLGPCPKCQGWLILFSHKTIPVDKHVLLFGNVEQKKEHLLGIITAILPLLKHFTVRFQQGEEEASHHHGDDSDFLHLYDGGQAYEDGEEEPDSEVAEKDGLCEEEGMEVAEAMRDVEIRENPITKEEYKDFVNIDLNLIDKWEYFQKFFTTTGNS